MQLKVKQNLGQDKVILTYKSTPTKPNHTPNYIIKKDKADEFIKKYNSQDRNLSKFSVLLTMITSATAGILSIKQIHLYKSKLNIFKPLLYISGGIITGLLASSIISSKLKNNLMDKYDVIKYK
mgnify:FL=1